MKKVMKNLFSYMAYLGVLCIISFLFFQGYRSYQQQKIQQGIAGEILRFHILANSDRKEDQETKLYVRDEIAAYMKELLKDASDREEAEHIIENHLESICKKAQEVLPGKVKNRHVRAEIATDYFPEKEYGDCSFPAGEYRALRITLGEGKGHNWWCVVYPNLCFLDESCRIVSSETKKELKHLLTEEEYESILKTDCKKIRFRTHWL